MGFYRVVIENGIKKLKYLAGATRGEGCPLGMWASFENDIAPNDNWLKEGTTFDATKYPALALYLGGNTVPERYDHSRLGEIEDITLSTNSTNPTVMDYDGFLTVSNIGDRNLTINNLTVKIGDYYSGSNFNGTYCTPIKKGDRVYTNYSFSTQKVRLYKHPLFIKATSNMSESEATGILNLINQRESYSTEEVNTGKKWIDGKTVYKKDFYFSGNAGGNHPHGITNIDTLIKASGTYHRDSATGGVRPLNGYSAGGVTYGASLNIDATNIGIETIQVGAWNVVVKLEYTKTTD